MAGLQRLVAEPRCDIPNLGKIKKPGILSTLGSVTSAGLTSFMNGGVFPISGQEPLTEMQRKAEMYEFAPLLEKARKAPKASTERLLLVTAFNIFGWTGACLRTEFKAMRPMDYETFDFISPELGFAFFTEFVKLYEDDRYSAVSLAHGEGWSLLAEACASFKLLTTSILFNGNYAAELAFDDGDTYVLSMPSGHVSGIATGNPVFSYNGKATVEHRSTDCSTEVDLTEPGMLSMGKKHKAKGYIVRGGKQSDELKIAGTWDGPLDVIWKEGLQETIAAYKVTGPPTNNKYSMPYLAVQLNHMTNALARVLPPTDPRRRLDIRALEAGKFEEADLERNRLLQMRDGMRATGIGQARWFSPRAEPLKAGPEEKLLRFKYDGGYWETRAAAERVGPTAWEGCTNIFDLPQ